MSLNRVSYLLVGVLLLTTSCGDDFLKDELLSNTSVDFLYTSPEGLEIATTGLYTLNRQLHENQEWNGVLPLIPVAKADLSMAYEGEISLFGRLFWGASTGDFGSNTINNVYFDHYYKIVERCNAIIAGAEAVEGMDDDQRQRIIAEAKCMRANSYFVLYRFFNNIVVNTDPTTPENAFDVPEKQSSVKEIFRLLKSDLDSAIANLDYAPLSPARWSQGSARHLRAKVAMWQGDWQEAADQIDALIMNGGHSLVATTADVFTGGNLDHSESLFTLKFLEETIGGGSPHILNWSCVAQSASAEGVTQSVENGGNGVGFLTLNDYAINLLNEDPNDTRRDGTYYIFEYKYNDPTDLPAGKQIGDPLDLYTNSDVESEWRLYYFRQNPGVLKYLDRNADPTSREHFSDIMIYRLAESYLIGAEAHLELGNTAKALEYINAVRTRANTAELTTIDLDAILDERARELAFEGQRWFTLKRRGLLGDYLRDHMNNDNFNNFWGAENPKLLYQDYMENWPISSTQLNLLGPNFPQNDGY